MNVKPQDSEISPEQTRLEYRKLAREIEQAFSAAKMRRSAFGAALLDEIPTLYDIDPVLMKEVAKIKGETLQRLGEALFELFAKAGKSTSDEVLKVRIRDLLTRFAAKRPIGGRRKKET